MTGAAERSAEPESYDDPLAVMEHLGVPGTRVRLLHVLRDIPDATISQLAVAVGSSRNNVLRHLDILEDLGLVQSSSRRVDGSFRPAACYRLNAPRVEEVAWLAFEAISHDRGLDAATGG